MPETLPTLGLLRLIDHAWEAGPWLEVLGMGPLSGARARPTRDA